MTPTPRSLPFRNRQVHRNLRFLLGLALLTAACGDRRPEDVEVYAVRGVYHGTRYDGAAASVDHEAIPGLMDPMRMEFWLDDPAEVEGLSPGDKVRFELALTTDGERARRFSRLPDTTRLTLAPSQP